MGVRPHRTKNIQARLAVCAAIGHFASNSLRLVLQFPNIGRVIFSQKTSHRR
jgi:hypothetical protein